MKAKSIFLLGRQPAIGRAELESVLSANNIQPFGDQAVACYLAPNNVDFARLGGSMRLCAPITTIETTTWPAMQQAAESALASILRSLPAEGKIKIGISVFGPRVTTKQLLAAGLSLKKICKQAKRSVRVIPNTEPQLNSAQVLHNQLTSPLGIELIFIQHQKQTLLARTIAVQNITAYAQRDQKRPKRDARVGMLPPKLAQTIVNLAAADTDPKFGAVVLDPFCGTGVVLQEAALIGFDIYGSDLEPRMIEYTDTNLQWLLDAQDTHIHPHTKDKRFYKLEVGDATNHAWSPKPAIVAGETYLGRPLSCWPHPEKLREIMGTCNIIVEKFLFNIHSQITPGTRLCLAIPCWKSPQNQFYHLPLLDHLEKIGYNRIRFEYATAKDLVYYRSDQIVARELLVITRK